MKSTNLQKDQMYINQSYSSSNFLYTVNRGGISWVNKNFCISRDNLYPYCNIHFVEQGSGIVVYKNKEYPVFKNQAFILNAFDAHIYKTNPTDVFRLCWIEFSGTNSIDIVKSIVESSSPIISSPCSLRTVSYIKKTLHLLLNDSKNNQYLVSKLIYTMLINLFQSSRNNAIKEISALEKDSFKKVLDYIEMNIGETIQVNQLAKIANFSPDYFSKIFKKITGDSPAKYINKRRILKAKECLTETKLPVNIIAENLGFCDTSHFTNRFKKAEGLTPGEFRIQSKIYTET